MVVDCGASHLSLPPHCFINLVNTYFINLKNISKTLQNYLKKQIAISKEEARVGTNIGYRIHCLTWTPTLLQKIPFNITKNWPLLYRTHPQT